MIAFIDPATKQVMAYYSHDTTSTAWEEQGFVRVEVPEEAEALVMRHGRDCTLDGSKVTAKPNPVQPVRPVVKSRIELLEERIAALEGLKQ